LEDGQEDYCSSGSIVEQLWTIDCTAKGKILKKSWDNICGISVGRNGNHGIDLIVALKVASGNVYPGWAIIDCKRISVH